METSMKMGLLSLELSKATPATSILAAYRVGHKSLNHWRTAVMLDLVFLIIFEAHLRRARGDAANKGRDMLDWLIINEDTLLET